MIQKITGSWGAGEKLLEQVEIAQEMVEKYGWQDKITHPYENCPTKVTKILADCKDYYRCTKGTREYLIMLFNGLVPILNSWEEYEKKPKITVHIVETGKTIELLEEDKDLLNILKDVYEVIAE